MILRALRFSWSRLLVCVSNNPKECYENITTVLSPTYFVLNPLEIVTMPTGYLKKCNPQA